MFGLIPIWKQFWFEVLHQPVKLSLICYLGKAFTLLGIFKSSMASQLISPFRLRSLAMNAGQTRQTLGRIDWAQSRYNYASMQDYLHQLERFFESKHEGDLFWTWAFSQQHSNFKNSRVIEVEVSRPIVT